MQVDYPILWIRHQLPNMAAMGWAAIRNANPVTRPKKQPTTPLGQTQTLKPVPEYLVQAYAQWCGAPAQRYASTMPPHFCSHWAMPLLAQLGSLAPYNLLALLNQGVRMQIFKPMQRGQTHTLHGTLMDVADEGHRVRIHTQVRAADAQGDTVMVIDSYSTVPQKTKSSAKKSAEPPKVDYQTVGTWSVEGHDGLNFAILTGDFNPIHTIPAVGKRTRFKSLILHGFGQLARTWECVLNAGHTIGDLDVRWIKPLVMPSHDLQVQVGSQPDAQGWRALRLLAQDGSVHMVGRFHAQPQAKEQGA